MKRMLLFAMLIVGTVLVLVSLGCELIINHAARGRTFDRVDELPPDTGRTALLLGTNPVSRWGDYNLYYYTRIEAAAQLYRSHKVSRIIVSGSRNGDYNEPDWMMNDLVKAGVPLSACEPDYEGLSTIESIKHVRDVFHCDSIVIISQQFHNERAIFMASSNHIDAIALNAGNYYGVWWKMLRQMGRERISRIKAVVTCL